MSWAVLEAAPRAAGRTPVTISVSKAGRFVQRAFVTVHPPSLGDAVGWWRHDARCTVEVGSGEHAGRLRLTAGGAHRLTARRLAKREPSSPILQIMGLAGVPAQGVRRCPADWEVVGESLVISLPWAAAKGATKVAPSPARPPHKAAPVDQPKAADVPARVSSPKPHQLAVLRRIYDAGGKVRNFEGLRETDSRTLRECEESGLAEWQAHGSAWLLTPAGKHAVEQSRSPTP